jgi:hypothetical protein
MALFFKDSGAKTDYDAGEGSKYGETDRSTRVTGKMIWLTAEAG